ncbi:MAG: type II secretion system GspH family protein [Planctomycetes bacterium]|nr:type II secretion system GspH family protein [Planctomycetota bacterium]
MKTSHKQGFTLVEVVLAASLMSVLVLVGLSAFGDFMKMVENQNAITRADQAANRALWEIASLVKPAILPVYITKSTATREDTTNIWYDIDHRTWGFSGSAGKAWLTSLRSGMDSIAFVVPLDAQGVGDFLDDRNHLQIGQQRGDISYLAASATTDSVVGEGPDENNPDSVGFVVRDEDDGELVSVLAAMSPTGLTSSNFEAIAIPTIDEWRSHTAYDTSWDNNTVTAFHAIRFVPVLDSSGQPIVIQESSVTTSGASIDLDGDGKTDGTFHIGRLQMVYSGSNYVNYVRNGQLVSGSIPQQAIYLTPPVVLRRVDTSRRTPIFRLVSYSYSNINSSGNGAGLINENAGNGTAALSIKLLILENDGVTDAGKILHKSNIINVAARWYETTVLLKNMQR